MDLLSGTKVLAVVAHPDDETIGCGGLLARAARSGAECRVLLPLKRGDPRGIEHWRDILGHFRTACGVLGAEPVVVEGAVAVVDIVADTRVDEVPAAPSGRRWTGRTWSSPTTRATCTKRTGR